ncbi:hypothetical protein LTR78_008248 [Recurvomyces mirabilis]|uniref:CENP-V/GFA domain-containing protein n=1 Tax=Recurvomyces mirabilis TaxID=574656 RepID=A0AAE0WIX9_9PEZI|nr:hypothetical protein LTR78_008248 [Recurvomyces mirabilis]KAK5156533.1 hypothetical protein LTS14_004745 [Recurvomyces mirabilis]
MAPTTASQTCFCGATKLEFLTASMFATNFCVKDANITYVNGGDNLKKRAQSASIASGNSMNDTRCGECGTLMNRQSNGFQGLSFLRVGEVDQLDELLATTFKPRVEQFLRSKAPWIGEIDAPEKAQGQYDFS